MSHTFSTSTTGNSSQARPSLHQDISYKEHPNFQKSQLLALLSRNCLDVFPPFCPAIPQHHTMLPEKSMNSYLKFMNKQTWPIFLSLHFNFVPHRLLTLLKAITKWNAKVKRWINHKMLPVFLKIPSLNFWLQPEIFKASTFFHTWTIYWMYSTWYMTYSIWYDLYVSWYII